MTAHLEIDGEGEELRQTTFIFPLNGPNFESSFFASAECGGTYSENSTYFDTTTTTPCTITICKCQPDICYLRLNYDSFTVSDGALLILIRTWEKCP